MKITFKQRLKYFFDNTLSKGTASIVAWLSLITFLLVLFFAFIYLALGIKFENSGRLDFYEAFWQSLMRSLDPGTVAGDIHWPLRIVGIIVTLTGIFIFSSLIGILSTGLDKKLEQLRKGRSIILTKNYTLIIGWSPKIIHIIEQLIIANENQQKPSIVILSTKDKIEMEDEIKQKIHNTKNTKIICRTGDALEHNDLKIVNPENAKSIIILTPEKTAPELHDIQVIRTILSLSYRKENKNKKYHIIAEIKDKENLEAAEIAGGDEVSLIFTKDIVSKITAQTSHQPGLSIIYMQLLQYEGDEIYLQEQNELIGKTYKQTLFAYETSSVIGIKKANGKILINPEKNSIFEKNDKIIAISQDDDTIILSKKHKIKIYNNQIKHTNAISSIKKEKNIIFGWNSKTYQIICEIDNYVAQNSETTIVANFDLNIYEIENLKKQIRNQKLFIKKGDYSKRNVLLNLELEKFDNIIILANENMPIQLADAITLITLIHLRNISKEINKKFNIISEMYDQKNRELAEITEADDFIISHNFVSRILAQISENKDIDNILKILFSSEGSEIYLKNAENYVSINQELNFYTVLESASEKNETAIGYRKIKYSHKAEYNYGIVINPNKNDKIIFEKNDKIIVLAED
jgi:voltage-gated potassium channel Kch